MDGCNCFCWNWNSSSDFDFDLKDPEQFSLSVLLPQWPQGGGFAKGKICIGELELAMITQFESIFSIYSPKQDSKGATFYKPKQIPNNFHSLGHFCQSNNQPLQGFLLVAREISLSTKNTLPALKKPLDYTLIWSSFNYKDDNNNGDECGYFWRPLAPDGYKSLGFLVTKGNIKPSLDSIRCVRSDLTDICETHDLIIDTESIFSKLTPCQIWKVRPCNRGIWGKGVSIGTFFIDILKDEKLSLFCLKNFDSSLKAMPNLEQINAIINHYGPTVYFHPKEVYLPSSVTWFFKQGAILYKKGTKIGEKILFDGSNLPFGGNNDGEYFIDLPNDDTRDNIIKGNLESAELYVHVKPALGGTFTDIAMWVFCPFNGPATIKIGSVNIPLSKIGQHVGDWEHFTLRVNNFNGELLSVYFSQHSGGEWVNASNLEFINNSNKPIVYSSKSGHASFPHEGNYLQGSEKLGIGVRNDAVKSIFLLDSSVNYKIVAAEYLGDDVAEPDWLQYMREWGPIVNYSSRSELEKIIRFLPHNWRFTVENVLDSLPVELFCEEGPTGPKEKDNWEGDERC